MPINHVFLDLDGVLVDFVGAACKLHGVSPSLVTMWDFYPQINLTPAQFWDKINEAGEDWWASIEPYPWAKEVVDLCQRAGPLTIATTPSAHHSSSAGKVRWIRDNFGSHFRDYMLGPNKALFAQPGRVLVDDNEKTIGEFSAGGGHGILFPRPWNSLAGNDPVKFVRERLEFLK